MRAAAVCCLCLACFCDGAFAASRVADEVLKQYDAVTNKPSDIPGLSFAQLKELSERLQKTGIEKDKIPAVDKPEFLSISDANLSMDDAEIVFLMEHKDKNLVRIYPRRVMVWHEVINDALPEQNTTVQAYKVPGMPETAGDAYTLSYSPLTGSVVGFKSKAGKYPTTFGVSGGLLNGNSVLYDRISHSLWSQLLAGSIEGPFRGKRLERVQVTWARWGGVKERYGGLNSQFSGRAEVLSRATGFRRTYGRDPYGSYDKPDSYYNNTKVHFPVENLDTRLPPKTHILGIEAERAIGAVRVDAVKAAKVVNFSLGIKPYVAVYDEQIDAVRIFDRLVPGRTAPVTFTIFENALVDKETRTEWLPTGKGVRGPLREKTLKEILSVNSMWFAWAAFHKETQIFPAKEW